MKRYANILLVSVSFLLFSGCASTPLPTHSTEASFDGNSQTSGVLRFLPDGSLEITQAAKNRLDALAVKHGHRVLPPFKKNYGCKQLSSGTWSISLEAAEAWHKMIQIQKLDEINGSK